jgi:hypothetical protein
MKEEFLIRLAWDCLKCCTRMLLRNAAKNHLLSAISMYDSELLASCILLRGVLGSATANQMSKNAIRNMPRLS